MKGMKENWIGRRWVLHTCLGLLVAGGSALAQAPKVGFVESSRVLYETEEGKAGVQKLNQFTTEKQKQYEQMGESLARLQQQLNSQPITAGDDESARLQAEIEQKQVEMKRFQEDTQASFNKQQSELLQQISNKVGKLIEDFAKQNGYSAIFMRDESQAYVAPALNVTAEIVKLYNERFPIASADSAQPPGQ